MCGVVGGLGQINKRSLEALTHRGPDVQAAWQGRRWWLGHTRLSIIDVGERSNQPFEYGRVVLSYNGELWNYRAIKEQLIGLGRTFKTEGDTEVFAAALQEWGEAALPRLEGMFAVAWTEDGGETVHLARDRHGEVPLHLSVDASAFASELKALPPGARAEWVQPGEVIELGGLIRRRQWYALGRRQAEDPASAVREAIGFGSREREISDVGYCLLLSGGIDSSAIAYHVAKPGTVAYLAVGSGRSADEKAAREVAEKFRLDLRTVAVPDPTADDLARIVYDIEMPHKAQVEIAWACSHLARAMSADGFRVTFSGEGSDELWASYGMSYHGIVKDGWFEHRRRLFHDQHRKNFARCNKVFMASGVECRLPFLSTALVELSLHLPEKDVREKGRPKAILQRAYAGLLPTSVIERRKMTFQDGAGLQAACALAVADPQRFYRAEFSSNFKGVDP